MGGVVGEKRPVAYLAETDSFRAFRGVSFFWAWTNEMDLLVNGGNENTAQINRFRQVAVRYVRAVSGTRIYYTLITLGNTQRENELKGTRKMYVIFSRSGLISAWFLLSECIRSMLRN